MKDDNFIVIAGWMINRLGLSGTELMIFAVIYGFSQGQKGHFTGSAQYLQNATGKGRSAIFDNLKKLQAKGLIKKKYIIHNDEPKPVYEAVAGLESETRTNQSEKQTEPVRKADYTSPKTGRNSIVDNIEDTYSENIEPSLFPSKKGKPKESVFLPWEDQEFVDKWELYKTFRNQEHNFLYKSSISEQAALKKLNDLAKGEMTTAIQIIQQTLDNNWKGLFELKEKSNERISESQQEYLASRTDL